MPLHELLLAGRMRDPDEIDRPQHLLPGHHRNRDRSDARLVGLGHEIAGDPRRVALVANVPKKLFDLLALAREIVDLLAGITREPDLYACAFAYGGIYDLDALFEQGELAQTPQGRALLRQTLGDREDDAEDIAARSPLQRVNRIKTPLFVAHGRADGLVPIAQYEALLRALEAARIPHRELVFDDEAHGIADPGNRLKYYTELLEFLARHTARAGD